ncbi:hypothetical protein ATO10_01925 [Actibacterium atlanticum]|uniref:Uncharacterized protein n=1 Tax=Actibacterium atlanticum TaxID=1461693 RepID=A0A058ZPF5_9RHOB|nr:hypothetical protein [Actibacterium atlanticum]KCV83479.1 hypothetical protein ATO10_01925 [Actibacterium atlanticum]
MIKRVLLWGSVALVLLAAGFIALFKPARVLVPQVTGMTCVSDVLCLDDPAFTREAAALRDAAMAQVSARLGPFEVPPRVLFCRFEGCFDRFGDPRIKAQNVGRFGMVINATGWSQYIVAHEMIHQRQAEVLGTIATAYTLPRWFVEGMAYSLSDDPRETLPMPQLDRYRARFNAWAVAGGDWRNPGELAPD